MPISTLTLNLDVVSMDGSLTERISRERSTEPSGERFANKVLVVTGASDRGIGGAIVERFAREGANVCVLSRSEPRRLRKIIKRLPCESLWKCCDVLEPDQIRNAVDAVVDRFGKIDVLVNNAGIEVAKRLEDMADKEWRELLEVNLHGTIQMSRSVLPHLAEPGGVIVNISSALAFGGCAGFSVYSASKAALVGFTQSLAWEVAPRFRVVGVAPGLVYTPMVHKYVAHMTPDVSRRLNECHPLGIGTPHDVASAVAFLASEDARWITGVTLPLGWAPSYPLPVDAFVT